MCVHDKWAQGKLVLADISYWDSDLVRVTFVFSQNLSHFTTFLMNRVDHKT